VAGPERIGFDALARRFLVATGDKRRVIRGRLTRCIRHQTRRQFGLTAGDQAGSADPFRGLARPSGSLATTRPLALIEKEEPSKPVHVHPWRDNSCLASGGMRRCSRHPANCYGRGSGSSSIRSRSRTRSYLRDRTHQATDSVTSYPVAAGLFATAGIFLIAAWPESGSRRCFAGSRSTTACSRFRRVGALLW